MIGDYEIKVPLLTYLFYQQIGENNFHNQCRIKGMNIDESMQRIDSFLSLLLSVMIRVRDWSNSKNNSK